MSLNQLQHPLSYRTGRGDLVKGRFVPCLEHSVVYRRAAGYFTSANTGLALAAEGRAGLVFGNGPKRMPRNE